MSMIKSLVIAMVLVSPIYMHAMTKKAAMKHKQQAGLYRKDAHPDYQKYRTDEQ